MVHNFEVQPEIYGFRRKNFAKTRTLWFLAHLNAGEWGGEGGAHLCELEEGLLAHHHVRGQGDARRQARPLSYQANTQNKRSQLLGQARPLNYQANRQNKRSQLLGQARPLNYQDNTQKKGVNSSARRERSTIRLTHKIKGVNSSARRDRSTIRLTHKIKGVNSFVKNICKQCCGSGSGVRDPVPFWPLDPDPGSGLGFFPDPGSRIPNSYFWELRDKYLGKKFYNSLKTDPNFFLTHFKNK